MTDEAPFVPPTSIDEVLAALDLVISGAIEAGSRVGYFAAMYRKVTAKVKEGVEQGFFDDPARMEHLDAVFAGRYLEALWQFEAGEKPTRSWALALDAAGDSHPLIVQQLLVGVNAHINLDLGIAAASVSPGAALPSLRRDFDRINEILALQVSAVEHSLGDVSPWIGMLDWIGGRDEEAVIKFSIEIARTEAWRFANELAPLARADWGGPVGARDTQVARLARVVLDPGMLLHAGLLLIRSAESNDVRRVIGVLGDAPEPDLQTVDMRVRQERASE